MNLELWFYWKLFWRRLPVMMLFILIAASLGVITAMKLPDTYSTTARLLLEEPQIPDSMVTSIVQTDALEQLDIVEQKLVTRANLIDIANRFNVFEDLRSMDPDTVVQQMRSATSIRRTAGRGRATLLRISFEARSGQIAANVVNEYVTLVLAENARFRRSRTESTLDFFEQEVERLGDDLDSQSASIAKFKADNATALPENQPYRLGRQTLLQERLSRLERDLSAGEQQRQDILTIFESTGRVEQGSSQRQLSPVESRLARAQADLDQARLLYSEQHPRIIQLQTQIDRLEATLTEQAGTVGTDAPEITAEQALLQSTLLEIDNRLSSLRGDIEATTEELDTLQRDISRSSSNGIELAKLERDFEVIQGRYNRAVNSLSGARMSERVETTAQGQKITVIETGNVPRVPTGPDRPKIALAGAAAGLMAAFGYFMLLEILNRTIRRPSELVSRFNVTPITAIPYMESRRRRIIRRSGILTATLAVLIMVPSLLWYIDTHYLPLELVVQKGLNKLGLG
ncbi:chain length-determining protein [uncultured Roseobacter sp.]|uniref:GumC family protein n=1 Tax=uncultured Roseobacter sp. TaxID=114847 RepID=UPI00262ECA5E|nr:chain length-determining protein [uncultured Roseobacter sp.]